MFKCEQYSQFHFIDNGIKRHVYYVLCRQILVFFEAFQSDTRMHCSGVTFSSCVFICLVVLLQDNLCRCLLFDVRDHITAVSLVKPAVSPQTSTKILHYYVRLNDNSTLHM